MAVADEVREALGRAVDFYQRGILSPALFWDWLVEALAPLGTTGGLDILPRTQQAVVRRAYHERPLALRLPGRDSELRRRIEVWCQIRVIVPPPAVSQQLTEQARAATAPRDAAPLAAPDGPPSQLARMYREHGYVRRPHGRAGRNRDWEVRFVFRWAWQVGPVRQLLAELGFQPGEAYRKHGYLMLRLSGRQATHRLLALVQNRARLEREAPGPGVNDQDP
jgi:hypothetical protein